MGMGCSGHIQREGLLGGISRGGAAQVKSKGRGCSEAYPGEGLIRTYPGGGAAQRLIQGEGLLRGTSRGRDYSEA